MVPKLAFLGHSCSNLGPETPGNPRKPPETPENVAWKPRMIVHGIISSKRAARRASCTACRTRLPMHLVSHPMRAAHRALRAAPVRRTSRPVCPNAVRHALRSAPCVACVPRVTCAPCARCGMRSTSHSVHRAPCLAPRALCTVRPAPRAPCGSRPMRCAPCAVRSTPRPVRCVPLPMRPMRSHAPHVSHALHAPHAFHVPHAPHVVCAACHKFQMETDAKRHEETAPVKQKLSPV